MTIYYVQVGVFGHYDTTVDAADEDEAYEQAMDELEDNIRIDGLFATGIDTPLEFIDAVEDLILENHDPALD